MGREKKVARKCVPVVEPAMASKFRVQSGLYAGLEVSVVRTVVGPRLKMLGLGGKDSISAERVRVLADVLEQLEGQDKAAPAKAEARVKAPCEFQVGDRVVYTRANGAVPVGTRGNVTSVVNNIRDDDFKVKVKWDNGESGYTHRPSSMRHSFSGR